MAPMISRGARRQAGCRDEPKSTQLFFLDLEAHENFGSSCWLLISIHPFFENEVLIIFKVTTYSESQMPHSLIGRCGHLSSKQ